MEVRFEQPPPTRYTREVKVNGSSTATMRSQNYQLRFSGKGENLQDTWADRHKIIRTDANGSHDTTDKGTTRTGQIHPQHHEEDNVGLANLRYYPVFQ